VIDRTEHDERTQSKKSRETVDDDPAEPEGGELEITTEPPEGARTAV
jgi:hypothetical protein